MGAAGVEVGRGLLRVGAGVSKICGEDDMGGFHVVDKVVVAFGL